MGVSNRISARNNWPITCKKPNWRSKNKGKEHFDKGDAHTDEDLPVSDRFEYHFIEEHDD